MITHPYSRLYVAVENYDRLINIDMERYPNWIVKETDHVMKQYVKYDPSLKYVFAIICLENKIRETIY